jgi:SM-20-related protein
MGHKTVPLIDAFVCALRDASMQIDESGPTLTGAPVLILDEFLAREEIDDVVDWVLSHRERFVDSHVVSRTEGDAVLDTTYRRSKVVDAGPFQRMFEQRLLSVVDYVWRSTGQTGFPIATIEMQVTASNDGEYFRCHNDNTGVPVGDRHLTYVYFFHREPKRFRGGRLRLYETHVQHGRAVCGGPVMSLEPIQNSVVFFPSHYYHEVEPVQCPSREFVDSRFTINGWFRSR